MAVLRVTVQEDDAPRSFYGEELTVTSQNLRLVDYHDPGAWVLIPISRVLAIQVVLSSPARQEEMVRRFVKAFER